MTATAPRRSPPGAATEPATVEPHTAAHALIDTLRATQATIEAADDPREPGRVAYQITGPTREIVQSAINKTMLQVDAAFGGKPGRAEFTPPIYIKAEQCWLSLGYVIRRQVAA